jgi:succinoglycan biosynthesis transport protein ExoP
VVRREEARLDREIQQVQDAVARLGDSMIELNILTAEAERDEHFFKNLDQRMTEVGLSQFLQANNIRFVDRAIASPDPVRPQVLLNLMTALMVGLMGGSALALLIELLDSSVKSREDVESASGVPLLGVVPRVDPAQLAALEHDVDRSIVVHALPRSTYAECLRTIRTNLQFRHGKRPLRRLLVTSAAPREGKSFLSTNLAAIIAMTGSRVLAIDGDLRRPTLHKRFQVPNERGFADVLAGTCSLEDAIQATHVPGLSVLVAGPSPDNPSERMGPGRLQEVLDAITGYDLVLLDSPPVHVVSDALVLASLADGVVFVVESDRTPRGVVRACCARLLEANPNLLGTVVNKLDARHSGYEYSYDYGGEYRYYLGEDENVPEPAAS